MSSPWLIPAACQREHLQQRLPPQSDNPSVSESPSCSWGKRVHPAKHVRLRRETRTVWNQFRLIFRGLFEVHLFKYSKSVSRVPRVYFIFYFFTDYDTSEQGVRNP